MSDKNVSVEVDSKQETQQSESVAVCVGKDEPRSEEHFWSELDRISRVVAAYETSHHKIQLGVNTAFDMAQAFGDFLGKVAHGLEELREQHNDIEQSINSLRAIATAGFEKSNVQKTTAGTSDSPLHGNSETAPAGDTSSGTPVVAKELEQAEKRMSYAERLSKNIPPKVQNIESPSTSASKISNVAVGTSSAPQANITERPIPPKAQKPAADASNEQLLAGNNPRSSKKSGNWKPKETGLIGKFLKRAKSVRRDNKVGKQQKGTSSRTDGSSDTQNTPKIPKENEKVSSTKSGSAPSTDHGTQASNIGKNDPEPRGEEGSAEEVQVPEDPEVPQVPAEPEVTQVSEETEIPQVPADPEVTQVPEDPEIPQVPADPEVTQVPEAPGDEAADAVLGEQKEDKLRLKNDNVAHGLEELREQYNAIEQSINSLRTIAAAGFEKSNVQKTTAGTSDSPLHGNSETAPAGDTSSGTPVVAKELESSMTDGSSETQKTPKIPKESSNKSGSAPSTGHGTQASNIGKNDPEPRGEEGSAEEVQVPEDPEIPQVPAEPKIPQVLEDPVVPRVPEDPEIPRVPADPEVPQVPAVPEIPQVPEAPGDEAADAVLGEQKEDKQRLKNDNVAHGLEELREQHNDIEQSINSLRTIAAAGFEKSNVQKTTAGTSDSPLHGNSETAPAGGTSSGTPVVAKELESSMTDGSSETQKTPKIPKESSNKSGSAPSTDHETQVSNIEKNDPEPRGEDGSAQHVQIPADPEVPQVPEAPRGEEPRDKDDKLMLEREKKEAEAAKAANEEKEKKDFKRVLDIYKQVAEGKPQPVIKGFDEKAAVKFLKHRVSYHRRLNNDKLAVYCSVVAENICSVLVSDSFKIYELRSSFADSTAKEKEIFNKYENTAYVYLTLFSSNTTKNFNLFYESMADQIFAKEFKKENFHRFVKSKSQFYAMSTNPQASLYRAFYAFLGTHPTEEIVSVAEFCRLKLRGNDVEKHLFNIVILLLPNLSLATQSQ